MRLAVLSLSIGRCSLRAVYVVPNFKTDTNIIRRYFILSSGTRGTAAEPKISKMSKISREALHTDNAPGVD